MKKLLITIVFIMMAAFSLNAQSTFVYQPDSVKFYINTAEYPFSDPIDSVGWIKFSYDDNGLLTHYRREAFSEELWYYDDYTYEYDSYHNLIRANIGRDSHDAMYRTFLKEEYNYQDYNHLSTYTQYFDDPYAFPDHNPWILQDSISHEYDASGRLSKKWELCVSAPNLYTMSDYEYQDNKVTIVTQQKNGSLGEWKSLNKRTLLYSNDGKLLSCLLETDNNTFLTTYSYNEQGLICGILKQKRIDDEYVNSSRVFFELNEVGYPSIVNFEKWEEQWVEGCNRYTLPHLRNTDTFFVFSSDYLTQQNYLILIPYCVKRLELYYSQTPKPNYDVKEQNISMASATIHPNPTAGQFTVTGKDLRQAEVFNTLGQRILTVKGEGETLSLDLNGQPAGIYFVSITDREGRTCVKKVVKE